MKVSVIVPVYNVEAYLDKCLKSLVNQTLKDIEIIIINDSSPDNSEKIINKYLGEYGNIKYYKKNNGGISEARNFGVKRATGEYIAFVDSDDYVRYDMYEKMYNKAKSGNFDIVTCDLNYVYEDSLKQMVVSSGLNSDTTNIRKVMINFYPVVWNKIFKRKLFDLGVEFKKGAWYEDVEFLYRIMPYVKSIGVVKEPFNQYLQRKGSASKCYDDRIYHYLDNWNGIVKFYQDNNFYRQYRLELEYAYVRYIYATFIKQATAFSEDKYNEALNLAIKNVKEKFPNYRKNKYFYGNFKGIYLLLFSKFMGKIVYCVLHKK